MGQTAQNKHSTEKKTAFLIQYIFLKQRQTAVTAYLKSKQLLPFVFAWLSVCQYSMAEENPAAQRQTAVTAATATYLCMAVSMPVLGGRES